MDPILLCVRPGNYKATGTEPIRIKATTGAHFIGFNSQRLGIHFLRRIGVSGEQYDLMSFESLDASAREKIENASGIVFLRAEQDVDLYFKDRANFPYLEFELSVSEILMDTGPAKGVGIIAGVRNGRWEIVRRKLISIISAAMMVISLLRLFDLFKQRHIFLVEIVGEIVVSCVLLLISVHYWRPKERL